MAPVSSLQPSPASSMHYLTEQERDHDDGSRRQSQSRSRRGSFDFAAMEAMEAINNNAAESKSESESNVNTDADKALEAIGQVMQMPVGHDFDFIHDEDDSVLHVHDRTTETGPNHASISFIDFTLGDSNDADDANGGGCAGSCTQDQTQAQIRHGDGSATSRCNGNGNDGYDGYDGEGDGTISSEQQQHDCDSDMESHGGILRLVVTPEAGEGTEEANVERADAACPAAVLTVHSANANVGPGLVERGLFTLGRISGEENAIGVDHSSDTGRLSSGGAALESTVFWTADNRKDIVDAGLAKQFQEHTEGLHLRLSGEASAARVPALESCSSAISASAGQELDTEPCLDRLHSLDTVVRPSLPASAPIAITAARPRRASAIPRHIRRTIFSTAGEASPQHGTHGSTNTTPLKAEEQEQDQEGGEEDGRAPPSPQSSIEDFGVVLNISPGHFAYAAANAHRDSVRLRPESFALDPDLAGLPAQTTTQRTRSPLAALEEKPLPELPPSSPASASASTSALDTPASEEASSASDLESASASLVLSSSISFESEESGNDQIKVETESDSTVPEERDCNEGLEVGDRDGIHKLTGTLATVINDDDDDGIDEGTHEQGDRVFSIQSNNGASAGTEVGGATSAGAGTPADNALNYATPSSSSSVSRESTITSLVAVDGNKLSTTPPALARLEVGSSVARLSLVAESEAAFEPESFVELAFDCDTDDVPVFEQQQNQNQQQQEQYQYQYQYHHSESEDSAGQDHWQEQTDYYTTSPSEYFDEEEDSSMLPPLSTLPEEDPVFSLSPSRSRSHSRVGGGVGAYSPWGEYPLTPARTPPLSRKPSSSSHNSSVNSYSSRSGEHHLNADHLGFGFMSRHAPLPPPPTPANSRSSSSSAAGNGKGFMSLNGLPARPKPRAHHVAGSASADFGAAGASGGTSTAPSRRHRRRRRRYPSVYAQAQAHVVPPHPPSASSLLHSPSTSAYPPSTPLAPSTPKQAPPHSGSDSSQTQTLFLRPHAMATTE